MTSTFFGCSDPTAALRHHQRAEQLRLHRHGQLADLVQEKRAAARLEYPGLRFDRSRKRAADVSEELALEQRVDDGRAVDRDERFVAPRPRLVEGTGGELLTGPGLAADQHDLGVGRQPLNEAEHLLHDGAAPKHPVEFELPRDLAFQRRDLRAAFELLADLGQQLFRSIEVGRRWVSAHRA